jgi:hypothetical protein
MMVRYSFVCRRHLFGVGITSRTGERVSARPKFLAHHSFHPQSWKNYIHVCEVQGCPAEHFTPLLDGIVHLHFYLWLLLPILRHPCCLYYIKQWICALLIHVLCLLLLWTQWQHLLQVTKFGKWWWRHNDDASSNGAIHLYPTMTTQLCCQVDTKWKQR